MPVTGKHNRTTPKPSSPAEGRTNPQHPSPANDPAAIPEPPYLTLNKEQAERLARLSHDLGEMWSAVPSLAYAMIESVDVEEGADAAYVALKYLSELASYKADAISGALGFDFLRCSRHSRLLEIYAERIVALKLHSGQNGGPRHEG